MYLYYVPGNHEYYNSDFKIARDMLLNANISQVYVLDRHTSILKIGNEKLRIIGATLWTDYNLVGDNINSKNNAKKYINDFKFIYNNNNYFTPDDAENEHWISRKYIINEIKKPFNGYTIILTHHVPHSIVSNEKFPIDYISASFYSNCEDLMNISKQNNVNAFIFGHHHWCINSNIEGINLLSAQLGYPNENTGWNNVPIFEL